MTTMSPPSDSGMSSLLLWQASIWHNTMGYSSKLSFIFPFCGKVLLIAASHNWPKLGACSGLNSRTTKLAMALFMKELMELHHDVCCIKKIGFMDAPDLPRLATNLQRPARKVSAERSDAVQDAQLYA